MKPKILEDSEKKHFKTYQLSEEIYALIGKKGKAVGGNSMIVDLGGKTLVFDTFVQLEAAKELLEVAQELTQNNEFIVANSHFHFDHVRGNQVFPTNSQVISSEGTREIMATQSIEEIEKNKENWPLEQEKRKSNYLQEEDPEKKDAQKNIIEMWQLLIDQLPHLRIRLPDISFDSRVTYHGSKRDAQLLTFGGAHTSSDVFLYLPGEKILHTADVVLNQINFYMVDGIPWNWSRVLESLSVLEVNLVVPGHGEIGGSEMIQEAIQYIKNLEDHVKRLENDLDENSLDKETVQEPYNSWMGGKEGYLQNLKLMYSTRNNK